MLGKPNVMPDNFRQPFKELPQFAGADFTNEGQRRQSLPRFDFKFVSLSGHNFLVEAQAGTNPRLLVQAASDASVERN